MYGVAGIHPRVRAEVRAAELDDALAGEEHHLPVQDAAGALPHRDAGGLQFGEAIGVEALVAFARVSISTRTGTPAW